MDTAIILASSSPYRAALLKKLQLPFSIAIPDIDEQPKAGESPQQLVARLAEQKAQAVAATHPGSLVIGSDQVCVLDGRITGKPHSHARAVAQLKAASGRRVTFYTGLALVHADSGRCHSRVEPFHIQFRNLSEAMIERYLKQDQPYQCAGSFKSEGLGIALFEKMEGDDPNTLVGLPLIQLVELLAREGVNVL